MKKQNPPPSPAERLNTAVNVMFIIAALSIGAGLIAVLFQVQLLQEIGIGAFSVLFGLIFLGLGFLVKRFHSMLALLLAILIFGADTVLTPFVTTPPGEMPRVGGVVIRILLLLWPMIQGVAALRALKKEERQSVPRDIVHSDWMGSLTANPPTAKKPENESGFSTLEWVLVGILILFLLLIGGFVLLIFIM